MTLTLEQLYSYANDDTNKEYLWWTCSSGRIELVIKQSDAHQAYHQGDCHADSMALIETDYIKMQLDKLDLTTIREEVAECGVDIDSLSDTDIKCYLVWIACGDIVDNEETPE